MFSKVLDDIVEVHKFYLHGLLKCLLNADVNTAWELLFHFDDSEAGGSHDPSTVDVLYVILRCTSHVSVDTVTVLWSVWERLSYTLHKSQ